MTTARSHLPRGIHFRRLRNFALQLTRLARGTVYLMGKEFERSLIGGLD